MLMDLAEHRVTARTHDDAVATSRHSSVCADELGCCKPEVGLASLSAVARKPGQAARRADLTRDDSKSWSLPRSSVWAQVLGHAPVMQTCRALRAGTICPITTHHL